VRIAFFTDSFLPTHDGVAQETASLARALARQGHAVTVFTCRLPGTPREETTPEGVLVVRSASVPIPHYGQYRWAILPLRALVGRKVGHSYDVIHLHTPGSVGIAAFVAARHFGLPLVGTFHTNIRDSRESFPDDAFTSFMFHLAWWFNMGIYWRCDLTTAPTLAAKHSLEHDTEKPYRHPIVVVPNGIETERFRPGITSPDWRSRLGAGGAPIVLFLGRLTQDKGVYRFLDALEGLPEDLPFRGVVGGTGVEAHGLTHRIAGSPRLRERVTFVGAVAEEEKAALLSQSRIFVLPSTADTSSVALLEAMACGLACVVTKIGGPRFLVEDGRTALLTDPEDIPALRAAIQRLLEEPALADRLGARAVEHVRASYSIDASAREFIRLYDHLRASTEASERAPTSAPVGVAAGPR
jgi:1,2-diacylglycerol 3-alpha-glucosyltransferase